MSSEDQVMAQRRETTNPPAVGPVDMASETATCHGYVRRFQELEVYRRSRRLARQVFEATRHFPPEERYSLTDQLRRSSRSIGAQVAEAWAKRRYERHFVTKLTDADGEQLETQHWLTMAFDSGYLTKEQAQALGEACLAIGRMLGGMIRQSSSFCQPDDLLREEPPRSIITDY